MYLVYELMYGLYIILSPKHTQKKSSFIKSSNTNSMPLLLY